MRAMHECGCGTVQWRLWPGTPRWEARSSLASLQVRHVAGADPRTRGLHSTGPNGQVRLHYVLPGSALFPVATQPRT